MVGGRRGRGGGILRLGRDEKLLIFASEVFA